MRRLILPLQGNIVCAVKTKFGKCQHLDETDSNTEFGA